MSLPQPTVLGLKPSFGFGDRLGLATPGHLDAARQGHLAPIFAQQSIREMSRTERTPDEVMTAAQAALRDEGFAEPWGADADHLKTREDVVRMTEAGFTFFTIDPSAQVENQADRLSGPALAEAAQTAVGEHAFASLDEACDLYLDQAFDLADDLSLEFTEEALLRAVVKYGRAVAYSAQMGQWIAEANGDRPHEIEVSVDETDSPTSVLEHLFVGLELRRRGVPVVSLAPRFIGEFEKGIDYKGDLAAFEAELKRHVAVARHCGPYKISVHSGSDKFAIYPAIGRVCGDLLHVKTAGTSYLEALRVLARKAPARFREVVAFCRGRYGTDRATYHVSGRVEDLRDPASLSPSECEAEYLDDPGGRQVMHVTFGSVLTQGRSPDGRPFKDALLDTLRADPALHREIIAAHLGKHVRLLCGG